MGPDRPFQGAASTFAANGFVLAAAWMYRVPFPNELLELTTACACSCFVCVRGFANCECVVCGRRLLFSQGYYFVWRLTLVVEVFPAVKWIGFGHTWCACKPHESPDRPRERKITARLDFDWKNSPPGRERLSTGRGPRDDPSTKPNLGSAKQTKGCSKRSSPCVPWPGARTLRAWAAISSSCSRCSRCPRSGQPSHRFLPRSRRPCTRRWPCSRSSTSSSRGQRSWHSINSWPPSGALQRPVLPEVAPSRMTPSPPPPTPRGIRLQSSGAGLASTRGAPCSWQPLHAGALEA